MSVAHHSKPFPWVSTVRSFWPWQELIQLQRPGVVLVELHPALSVAAGYGSARQVLRQMHAWGYTEISHSGRFCDARWYDITRSIRCAAPFPTLVAHVCVFIRSSSTSALT